MRTIKKPMLSDLKDSGGIEEHADAVIMLYREEYYDPDSENAGKAEVIVAKNRTGGKTGVLDFDFDSPCLHFYESPFASILSPNRASATDGSPEQVIPNMFDDNNNDGTTPPKPPRYVDADKKIKGSKKAKAKTKN